MERIQAALISLETVQSKSLVAELKPYLQSVFLDILRLFICKLEGAVDIDQVEGLLKQSSENLVIAKEVSDRHLAVAKSLWKHSVFQINDAVFDLDQAVRGLKEREEKESCEVSNKYPILQCIFRLKMPAVLFLYLHHSFLKQNLFIFLFSGRNHKKGN